MPVEKGRAHAGQGCRGGRPVAPAPASAASHPASIHLPRAAATRCSLSTCATPGSGSPWPAPSSAGARPCLLGLGGVLPAWRGRCRAGGSSSRADSRPPPHAAPPASQHHLPCGAHQQRQDVQCSAGHAGGAHRRLLRPPAVRCQQRPASALPPRRPCAHRCVGRARHAHAQAAGPLGSLLRSPHLVHSLCLCPCACPRADCWQWRCTTAATPTASTAPWSPARSGARCRARGTPPAPWRWCGCAALCCAVCLVGQRCCRMA